MDSENIDEMIQEGGQEVILNSSPTDNLLVTDSVTKTVGTLWGIVSHYENQIRRPLTSSARTVKINNIDLTNPNTNGNPPILNRPLLLSDLIGLLNPSSDISVVFNALPIAQYKHLPDPNYLLADPRVAQNGGDLDESTLNTQEVSLPTKEEDLPSLDVVEPTSVGGSYKWSSHKKRKSTRTRTKKNKKI